jgi:transposase
VTLREYCCPACAASLVVDVATEQLDALPAPQVAARVGAPA